MPQLSLPEIKLSELGDRFHDATDDLPEEVRDRLADAGDRISDAAERMSDAGGRIGSEVGERLADFRWPGLTLPAALKAMPEVRLPSLSAPNMRAPNVDLPHVDSRDLRRAVARLEIPQVTFGRQKSRPPVVPIVILAAVGGAFLGWWLATSSYTSGKVRSLVHQARVRMGLAEEWDDTIEARTEDFWSDERGSATNQNPGDVAAGSDGPDTAAPVGPSGSISAEDGTIRLEADAGHAATDTDESATPAWPSDSEEASDRGAAVGGAWTEGGTGLEPDTKR